MRHNKVSKRKGQKQHLKEKRMAYKVYCSRCGTSEIVRSKLEVDHLTKKHWKEYNCGELAYDKVMARI